MVSIPVTETLLDDVFFALADPTRRKIIETVKEKDCTVAELSLMFDISMPAVSKHLKVLDRARLLKREKNGKFIICSYNREPIETAMRWIAEQHRLWKDSFDGLDEFLNDKYGKPGK